MSGDVIAGNYSDFKLVKTRSVIQIIIELPIEHAQEAITLLGMPIPGAEIPVALCRLKEGATTALEPEALPSPKKGTLAQQAGILCSQPAFWKWLRAEDEEEAAAALRLRCNVISRRDLDLIPSAGSAFRNMRSDFEVWMKDIA